MLPSDVAASTAQDKKPSHARSRSSQQLLDDEPDDTRSAPNSPPATANKGKSSKAHTVNYRSHARVHSSKGIHKLGQAHVFETGHGKVQRQAALPSTSPRDSMSRVRSDPKLARNSSATSVRPNSSHTSLKRNKSSVEVKRPKSAGTLKRNGSHTTVNAKSSKTAVHFALGDDGPDDGWTEASESTSPTLSRTGSVAGASSGRSSVKPAASASNSQPESPVRATTDTKDWSEHQRNTTPDAHQITSRLLKRTPSSIAQTQMSSVSATAGGDPSPEPFVKVAMNPTGDSQTAIGTPHSDQEPVTSHFKGSAGNTPKSSSTHLEPGTSDPPKPGFDDARRVKSMGNLSRKDPNFDVPTEPETSAIGSSFRARRQSPHGYNPPQQSRTQRKQWLERASSNIEPQALPPGGAATNGLLSLHLGATMPSLIGLGYDGRDPRIRMQLERTGQEYLVIRRYQNPIGRALRRLDSLPGVEHHRHIPRRQPGGAADTAGPGRHGLSQSLKEKGKEKAANGGAAGVGQGRNGGTAQEAGARLSMEGPGSGSTNSDGTIAADGTELDSVLRSLWEKSFDMSPSAE